MIAMRWMVSEDGGATYVREVAPMTAANFSYERDLSAGQIFFRHKLSSRLQFNRKEDWDFFYGLERMASKRCMELFIRMEWRCGLTWRVYWTGTFSVGAGSFNLDRCIFSVKPEVEDRYSCLLRNQNKKVNVLNVPSTTVNAVIFPSGIEFGLCNSNPLDQPDEDGCLQKYRFVDGWDMAVEYTNPNTGLPNRLYWRERALTECVGGVAVPPPGSGWSQRINNCDGHLDCLPEGTAFYTRHPTIPYTFGDPVFWIEGEDPTPEDCQLFVRVNLYQAPFVLGEEDQCRIINGQVLHFLHVCLTNGDVIVYDSARTLLECGEYILEKIGCPAPMQSDFLEWNAPGTAEGYSPGVNYVTGQPNQVNNLMLLQKSDAISPDATNPARIGEMTFKEFMQLLSSMRLFYDIDEDGNLRIEHWKHWTFPIGFDVADYQNIERRDYDHLKVEIPRYERVKWMEAQGRDFIGEDITYSGPCANESENEEVKEYSMGRVTTDLSFIDTDPAAISKEGFALLATQFNGTDYDVILDTGALSGLISTNVPLSTANLERDFWTWDRFLPTGNLNDVDVIFDGYLPNIQQRSLTITDMCCDLIDVDPKKRVQTALGTKLGNVPAHIQKIEFEEKGEVTVFTLRYPY